MIKQTGRLVGACRFVLAGDGLTLTLGRPAPIRSVDLLFARATIGIYA